MRKRVKIIAAVAVISVIGILIWIYMAFNRKEGDIEAGNPTTITPEATPTDTVMPTGEADITPEGTPIPVPELTVTPEATKAPEPTDMPTPAFTPAPSTMPTLEPSKEPTAAPEATKSPVGKPTPTPLVEYKKDGVDVPIVQTFQVSDTTYVYVYENGKLAVADSGTGYSKRYATNYKDPANVDIAMVVDCLLVDEAAALQERKITINPSLMPTPIPTPTPFPIPNPEKPKMLASFDCSESGSEVTQEMWDNGYIYIKGTGATRWIGTLNAKPEDEPALKALGFLNKYGFRPSHLVVGEGVTSLGDSPMCVWYRSLIYIELPSTLESIREQSFNLEKLMEKDITVSGYKNGERITFVVPAYTPLGDAIVENLDVKSK